MYNQFVSQIYEIIGNLQSWHKLKIIIRWKNRFENLGSGENLEMSI